MRALYSNYSNHIKDQLIAELEEANLMDLLHVGDAFDSKQRLINDVCFGLYLNAGVDVQEIGPVVTTVYLRVMNGQHRSPKNVAFRRD